MHLSNNNLFSFLLAGRGVGISNLFGALESDFPSLCVVCSLQGRGAWLYLFLSEVSAGTRLH